MPTTPDRPNGRSAGSGRGQSPPRRLDVPPARPRTPSRARPVRPSRRRRRGSPVADPADLGAGRSSRLGRARHGDGRTRRPDGREAGRVGEGRVAGTVRVDRANHETRQIDLRPAASGRPTVALERETVRLDRETVQVPGQRRPPERAGRAPLIVAAGFATLWAAVVSYLPVAAVIGLARTLEGAGGLGGAARRRAGRLAARARRSAGHLDRPARRSRRWCSPCWPAGG